MNEIDTVLGTLTAENLALRSLLMGLLIELVRRGHVGVVSNAFAYANGPLAGLTRQMRPTRGHKEAAEIALRQLRNEVLGAAETELPDDRQAGRAPATG